ncbi:MAG: 4Fe-4S binding protein [Armatimonadota bacterium]
MMAIRKIIQIDEELCNGCGQCVPSCAEGAIQVIDGKARLVKDQYCDGLGACLGECPTGALTVIERDADEFDEQAVETYLASIGRAPAAHPQHAAAHAVAAPVATAAHGHGGGCPGSMMRQFAAHPTVAAETVADDTAPSELRQWPVQLHLVSPGAPYFQGADLLLAADCAAFSYGSFHRDFIAGRAVAIACPKLDDPSGYVEKLAAMITESGIKSITVVMMQVPCCGGLERMVQMAMQHAGKQVPVRRVIVGLQGEILEDTAM